MTVEYLPASVCVHCGRKCGDTNGGSGSVQGSKLCHPNEPGRPDCYHMVTVYHHELVDCPRCRQEPYQPPTRAELHDAMLDALACLDQMIRDAMP